MPFLGFPRCAELVGAFSRWWLPQNGAGKPLGSHPGPRFLWRGDAFYGKSKAGAPPAPALAADPEREQRVAMRCPVHPHGGPDEGAQIVTTAVVSHLLLLTH